MKSLFQPHVNLVGKVMDLQLQRQNVVSSNIANVKTTGYRPLELNFEKELQSALALDMRGKLNRTHERHLPAVFYPELFEGDLREKFKPRVIHGEDRVNLDKEMAKMAKNSLQYTALSQIIKNSFEGLRNIITEGQK
jgi:flagellar basal-body rod protein FlgB